MLWRLSRRAVPAFFLVVSGLWAGGVYFPYLYSLSFPNNEIRHLVGALEGHESARQELSIYVQNTINSAGHLKHAIRFAAYYGVSAEHKFNQSHTSNETEYAYLAWFEKRPKPTIFVVNLSEFDGSLLRFKMREGRPLALARMLIFPLLAFSFCLYWFLRSRRSGAKEPKIELIRGSE